MITIKEGVGGRVRKTLPSPMDGEKVDDEIGQLIVLLAIALGII